MSCPDQNQLLAFLEESLSDGDAGAVSEHINACADCQVRLGEILEDREMQFGEIRSREAAGHTSVMPGDEELMRELAQRPMLMDDMPDGLATAMTSSGRVVLRKPSTELPLPSSLSHYTLIEMVGEGATGRLYRARDERLGRDVAIKILKPELAAMASARIRFDREARACAALRHDHIVAVHAVDAGGDGQPPFLVMEFVAGCSLQALLPLSEEVPLREAVEWVRQAARALQAAHDRGIVHRDIKPSNLLIEESTGRLKVADFGLARLAEAEETLTAADTLAGTPAYMSPEQIVDPSAVTGLTDIYSLGVVLYEVLTGERPFRGTVRMVLQQVQHEEPAKPRRLNDRVPRDLETVCLKAMSKEPRLRYASAREMAYDLQNWLEDRPVVARPVGPIGRTWRWCRRNPGQAGAAFIVFSVLVAGAIDWGQLRTSAVETRLRNELELAAHRHEELVQQSVQKAESADRQWLVTMRALRGQIEQQFAKPPGGAAALNAEGDRAAQTTPAELRQTLRTLTDGIVPEWNAQLAASHDELLIDANTSGFDVAPKLNGVLALMELSDLWALAGDPGESLRMLDRAVFRLRYLHDNFPEQSVLRIAVADAELRRAELNLLQGNPQAAEDPLATAEAWSSQLDDRFAVLIRATALERLWDIGLLIGYATPTRSLDEAAELLSDVPSETDSAVDPRLFRSSVARSPEPDIKQWRARILLKLAYALNRESDLAAPEACRNATVANEELIDVVPEADRPQIQWQLALCLAEMSACRARSDDQTQAAAAVERQCELLDELATSVGRDATRDAALSFKSIRGETVDIHRESGRAWLRLATLHTQLHNHAAALEAAGRAVDRLEALVDDSRDPADVVALAEANLLTISVQLSDGEVPDALDRLRAICSSLDQLAGDSQTLATEITDKAMSLRMQCENLIEAASPPNTP